MTRAAWTVAGAEARTRLDQFVARHAGCSRAEARRLIEAGAVRVGGRKGDKGTLLEPGSVVELDRAPPTDEERRPVPQTELPLTVLYVDDALVAVDKPPGIPTHPLRPGERGTLANALVARHPECALASDDAREGGVAHRLDTDTSGVILAARTPEAWRALRHAFSTGQVEKRYLALVVGAPPDAGEIRAPLAHIGDRRRVQAVDEYSDHALKARDALTRYEVLARGDEVAWVCARSTTGRMHQIRAHLAHAGHPLVGDVLYGGPPAEGGHVLHAECITFPHPTDGRRVSHRMTVTAPLPSARARLVERLLGAPIP